MYAGFSKRQIVDIFSGEVLAMAGQFITAEERDRIEAHAEELYNETNRLFGVKPWTLETRAAWLDCLNAWRRINAALILKLFIREEASC